MTIDLFASLPACIDRQISTDSLRVLPELCDCSDSLEELIGLRIRPDLAPLLVTPDVSGSYLVIDGCKRLRAARKESVDLICCRCFSGPIDTITCGALRIWLNADRELSVAEKVRFGLWTAVNSSGELRSALTQRLSVTNQFLEECTTAANCGPGVFQTIINQHIALQNSTLFSKLTDDEQIRFLELFASLHLSVQTQRQFLQWLPAIASAENRSVLQLLDESKLSEILDNAALNAPQKIQHVSNLIRGWRFPTLSVAEKKWESRSSKINPDRRRVSFTHAPFFESNRLEVTVRLDSPQSAKKVFSQLAQITEADWQTLINSSSDDVRY